MTNGAGEGNRTLVTTGVVLSGSEWPDSLGVSIEVQGYNVGQKRPDLTLCPQHWTLDAYASAFEHPLMDEARQLLAR